MSDLVRRIVITATVVVVMTATGLVVRAHSGVSAAAALASLHQAGSDPNVTGAIVPPIYFPAPQLPFASVSGTEVASPGGQPLAQLAPVPAASPDVEAWFGERANDSWATSPAVGISRSDPSFISFRALSWVRYTGSNQTVDVVTVQDTPGAKARGLDLSGEQYVLPDGTTAYASEVKDNSDRTIYVVQWMKGDFLIQLIAQRVQSIDDAKNLAADVTFRG